MRHHDDDNNDEHDDRDDDEHLEYIFPCVRELNVLQKIQISKRIETDRGRYDKQDQQLRIRREETCRDPLITTSHVLCKESMCATDDIRTPGP